MTNAQSWTVAAASWLYLGLTWWAMSHSIVLALALWGVLAVGCLVTVALVLAKAWRDHQSGQARLF